MRVGTTRCLKFLFAAGMLAAPLFACAQVEITEIMYDAPGSDAGHEWVELTNLGTSSEDLAGDTFFESGVHHRLTVVSGTTTITANESIIISDDPATFLTTYPSYVGTLFKASFSLNNTGESLSLDTKSASEIDTISYTSDEGASGDGNSLHRVDDTFVAGAPDPGIYTGTPPAVVPVPEPPADPAPTEASAEQQPVASSPPASSDSVAASPESSAPNQTSPPSVVTPPNTATVPITQPVSTSNSSSSPSTPAVVKITEIMYDAPGSDAGREWIELTNLGGGGANLTGDELLAGGTQHGLAVVSGTTTLGANESAIIAADPATFLIDHPNYSGTLFKASFSLNNTGGSLALESKSSATIDSIAYTSTEGASGDGNSLHRVGDTLVAGAPDPGIYTAAPPAPLPKPAPKQSAASSASAPNAPAVLATSSGAAAALSGGAIPWWSYALGLGALVMLAGAGVLYARPAEAPAQKRSETKTLADEFEIE